MKPPLVALTDRPIDPEAIRRELESPELGGVVVFCGEVRSLTGAQSTEKLEYEAYGEMATAQMRKIAVECAAKHGGNVACVHRIGELHPGDIAVVTAAACAHRDAAFACCRELIDRIKDDVPIWKKEFGPDGQSWVTPHP